MQARSAKPSSSRMSAAPAAAIGVGRVAHATPDGYTLSIGHVQTHVFNPAIMKLDYDVVNDFAPISLIADTPIWIVDAKIAAGRRPQRASSPGSRPRTARRPWARSASAARPTSPRAFSPRQTGTSFQLVPYRGGAPLARGPARRPHRFRRRPGGRSHDLRRRAASSRPMPCCSPSAGGRRPTCRRSTSSASTISTPASGTACGRPRARRRTSSPSSTPPFASPGRSDGAGALQESRPGNLAGRVSNARGAGGATEGGNRQWTPVIKEAGIKAE